MELYLLRHGIAEDGHAGLRDEDRALTTEGRHKLTDTLRTAARAEARPTLLLTSPLVRAVQTAEIAAKELGYSGETIHTKSLLPEASPHELWEELRTYRDEERVLLVSHNPLCASATGFLLGTPDLLVDYKKGAIVRIDLDRFGAAPRGVLRWFLTPKLAG